MKLLNKQHLIFAFAAFTAQLLQAAAPCVTCPIVTPTSNFCNVNVSNQLCVSGPTYLNALNVCTINGGTGFIGERGPTGPTGATGATGGTGAAGSVAVIPYAATVSIGALGLVGADLGFGTVQMLSVANIDLLSWTAPRAGTLQNLYLNITNVFLGIGTVEAEIYTSVDAGVTWTFSGISATITGLGLFFDNVNTLAVAQGDLIALRITPSILGVGLTVSAGIEFAP